jgi:hypothetical protein
MELGVQVVWWLGLAGAAFALVTIGVLARLVLKLLIEITHLAVRAQESAGKVSANLGAVARLAALDGPASDLRKAASLLSAAAGCIDQKLEILTDFPTRSDG